MTSLERKEITEIIVSQIEELESEIESVKGGTAPVEPDSSIGRLTRMDAMQMKEMNEAILTRARLRLSKLQATLGRVGNENFGICSKCEEPIPIERMRIIPESTRCIGCSGGKRR